MVDWAFINSHSYKPIWRRDLSVLERTESRFTELQWGVTYLLARSVTLTQHGSSGRLSATFSASPSNWWPGTPPDMGGSRCWPPERHEGSVQRGIVVCLLEGKHVTSQSSRVLEAESYRSCLTPCLVWVTISPTAPCRSMWGVIVTLTSSFNVPCLAIDATFT